MYGFLLSFPDLFCDREWFLFSFVFLFCLWFCLPGPVFLLSEFKREKAGRELFVSVQVISQLTKKKLDFLEEGLCTELFFFK